MGLDMYLRVKRCPRQDEVQFDPITRLEIESIELNLYYWRKHPNLHGFIVENFAKEDNCEPIELLPEDIDRIIDAIENDKLPHTEGFFFGVSLQTNEQKQQDLKAFRKAKELSQDHDIIYQASW